MKEQKSRMQLDHSRGAITLWPSDGDDSKGLLSKGDAVGLREGATFSCSALIAFLQLSHKLPDAAIPPTAVKGQCCAAQMIVPAKSEKHSEIYWYDFPLDMSERQEQ